MQDWGPSDFSFYVTRFRGAEFLKLSKHKAPHIVDETGCKLTTIISNACCSKQLGVKLAAPKCFLYCKNILWG